MELKGPTPRIGKKAPTKTRREKTRSGHRGIRCPRCAWRPGPKDRWACRCGHVWNTFDTRGRCPACAFQWHLTACLSCNQFSPHEDWYEPESRLS